MSVLLKDGKVDVQRLRHHLYDLLGLTFSAVSPAPACLPLMQSAGMIASPSGHFQCRGRVRGKGFAMKRFSVQEIRAVGGNEAAAPAFDGLIISLAHHTAMRGRTAIVPDRGPLNPRHIDGMKRVGVPSRRFEALYEIYGDDQTEARTLAPPDFLARLLDFDPVLVGGHANLAFVGRSVHLVLPTGPDHHISTDIASYGIKEATKRIANEMRGVFSHVAQLDALISKVDRHGSKHREEARLDYYETAAAAIEPAVMAAIESGDIIEDRRAKYLTKDAFMVDPALHGLLMPRV